MKIVGMMALHYGLSYIAAATRSIIDDVDELWYVYSPVGSHGFRTDTLCPEHAVDLYKAAREAAGDKFRWYADTWPHEGAQRETIFRLAPDADFIVTVDSDEIYAPGLVAEAIAFLREHSNVAYLRLPFVHFYKDFRHAVLHDPAFPVRVTAARAAGEKADALPTDKAVAHMGYCQPSAVIQYKMTIHGHSNELRPRWFETIYSDDSRWTDLHPVGSEWWNAEAVNPLDYLPAWMAEHPLYGLERVP
jgi:hypothetical protein